MSCKPISKNITFSTNDEIEEKVKILSKDLLGKVNVSGYLNFIINENFKKLKK